MDALPHKRSKKGVTFPDGDLIMFIGVDMKSAQGGAGMDDNELMLLTRDGNKEAYEILMKRYISQAKAIACRYVHDVHAAEDIVQESFVDIYLQRFSFDCRYRFSAYLKGIIRNKAMNYLKKNRELPASCFCRQDEEPLLERELVDTATPETEYLKKADFSELLEAVQRLSEEERDLLYLYAAKECSYREIAQRLGLTVMQVKIKLFRARKKLREARKE